MGSMIEGKMARNVGRAGRPEPDAPAEPCVRSSLIYADLLRGRGPASLLPSPLWGGVGGGGRAIRRTCATTSRPPTPTLPHKGGGRRVRPRFVEPTCQCA